MSVLITMWQFLLFFLSIAAAAPKSAVYDSGSSDGRTWNIGSAENEYLLYTRSNPQVSQTLVHEDIASILNSNFNGRLPIVVIVHGWLIKQDSSMNPTLRDAFLESNDVNVIVVDWRRLALADYSSAMNGIPDAGVELGEFLAFLNRVAGAQFHQMHLIGFGLGAHFVGVAGKHLGGRAARITGLDPAGTSWSSNPNRLDANDAIYVEAIHTNGGLKGLGIGTAIADADFFPNGGNSQPGCYTNHCSHNRSWELLASSVTNNHLVGRRCLTTLQLTYNTCRGSELRMGNDILTKSGSGTYRLDTARTYPY